MCAVAARRRGVSLHNATTHTAATRRDANMPPLPGDVQWFPAEIRRLIVAIKKHEALYNPRNEAFGLRDQQTRAWKAVAEEVGGGKSDMQCRDKWNCLRGTFRRHVRTEATNTVKRRSGWPWAEMMNFIKPFVSESGEMLNAADLRTTSTPPIKPAMTKAVVLTKPTVNVVKSGGQMTFSHKPNCPLTVPSGGTLTLGNMFPGGIIFNPNGIGIVQPNQNMIGVVQPSQVNLVQSNQGPVMKLLASQASTGVGIVQPTKKSESEKPKKTKSSEPDEVDLKKVKREDNGGELSSTEFVDMEVAIKTEPLDEDDLQLPETFNYYPEDSQENSQDQDTSSRESNVRSPDKNLPELSQEDVDSNDLFMRSTMCHMRKLSAYDQSVFKLKVQQLLHEMMFPKQP